MDEPGRVRLLDEPGEPLGAYLRAVLSREGLLGGEGDIVLPRLTAELICQVYAGLCPDGPARQVLDCLLRGGTVWCPWEGLELTDRAGLARLVWARLETLRRAGLVLCPLGRLPQLARRGRGRRSHGAGPGERFGLVYPQGRGAGGV